MPDPDPSDFRDAEPVNRVALFIKSGLFDAVGFPSNTSEVGEGGYVVDLDQTEGIKKIFPAVRRETLPEVDLPVLHPGVVYHCVYETVKHEINAGTTEEEIRARIPTNMDNIGELTDAVREAAEAVEDASACFFVPLRRGDDTWRTRLSFGAAFGSSCQ
jgi:hypothetical protein